VKYVTLSQGVGNLLKSYQIDDVQIHAVEGIDDVTKIVLPFGYLYGIDVETNGRDPFADGFEVRLVQLASEKCAYVFRMDEPWQVNYVKSLLADDVTSWVSYTDYDVMAVFTYLGIDISHRALDLRSFATMAAPDDRQGVFDLKTVTEKYLKVKWLTKAQKELQDEFLRIYKERHPDVSRPVNSIVAEYGWGNIDLANSIYVTYGGLDAVSARRLVPIIIKATGAPWSLVKNQIWLDAEAARMRMRGMLVDVEARDDLYNEVSSAVSYHEEEFGKIVWEPITRGRAPNKIVVEKPISPRSGKKVARYLSENGADFTDFPLTDKGIELLEAGELSTEDEVVGKYASLGKDQKDKIASLNVSPEAEQAIEHLFGFKEKVYFKTKLEEIAKVIDSDDIVHPVVRTCGTVTGRMSSSQPNTQNYPKKDPTLREIFIPSPGYYLIGCDFPNIEVRVGAGLSQCPVLSEILAAGRDLHQETADATGTDRQTAKITNFLCQYNGGPKALNAQTGIPYNEAKEIVAAYWDMYYGMKAYRNSTMRIQPEIRTISNRRIPVPYNYLKHEYMTYKNINYFIQSAAREMMCSAWWRFVNTPGTENMYMWAVIHDEAVVAVPCDELSFGLTALSNAMSFNFMGIEVQSEAILLADGLGRSFWTTGDAAEKYREERSNNGTLVQGLY
jgi:DNA polymerase-1